MTRTGSHIVSLRISGEGLVHEEVERMIVNGALQASPDESRALRSSRHRQGVWTIESEIDGSALLDVHIEALLKSLTHDLDTWKRLRERFKMDVFIGIFLKHANEGASVSRQSLSELAERGLDLTMDIYCSDERSES